MGDEFVITREPHGGGSGPTVMGEWVPGDRVVFSWVEGRAYVCAYRNGTRVVFHQATEADRAAMYCGQMAHDPVTCPSSKAWANHVANGGD